MLTIANDYSRATWTYLLSHKSQTLIIFKNFLNVISTQIQKHIKVIRLNNGGEFTSKDFRAFLLQHGILHHCTCAYTPQHNGVVKRKHKHLLQLARALLFQANMPTRFWDYALLMESHLVNLQ